MNAVQSTGGFAAQAVQPPLPTEGRRFGELEGIRGIAALLIVFYHLPYWHPLMRALPIVENGALMVELFFVLSGFVICGAYRTRITTFKALANFQLLRLGRLYPVHLLFLLFFLLVEFSKVVLASYFGIHSYNTQPFRENSWTAFVQQLLLVHPIGPFSGNAVTFNAPSWSIGVEFYTYLVFGLVVLVGPLRLPLTAAAISAVSFTLLAWGGLPEYIWVLKCLAGFFLGCLVQTASASLGRVTPGALLTVSVVAMVLYLCLPLHSLGQLVIFPVSAVLIFAIVTCPDGLWRRLFRSPPLAWLGRISYSLYMAHAAAIWVTTQAVRFALNPPQALSPTGHIDAQLSFVEAFLATAIVLVLTLGVGYLVCRFVEEPCREMTRQWVARRSRVRATAPAEQHGGVR